MDKIKEFFSQTWVKITSWCMCLLGSAMLIIGGATAAEIASGIEVAAGVISAVGALVVFITGKVKKTE